MERHYLKGVFGVLFLFIFTFFFTVYIIVDNFDLILYGKIVNLNEYVQNLSEYDDELPERVTVTLNVNRCYGQFYTYTSGGKHRKTHYLYAIGLDDGSIMILDIDEVREKEYLDRLTRKTLSSENSDTLVYNGKLYVETKQTKIKKYDDYVNGLIDKGIISGDTKIRYSCVIINYEGRVGCIIFLGLCIVFDVLFFLLLIETINGKELFKYKSNYKWKFDYMPLDMLNEPFDRVVRKKADTEFHRKYVRDAEFMGLSYRTLEIADGVIEYYKTHKIDDISKYIDYIMLPAEYCILQEKYDKAYDYLNNITEQCLIENMNHFYEIKYTVYKYWAVKMEAVRGLEDKAEAENIIEEAEKYWGESNLSDKNISFWKNVCYYHYYMLRDDIKKAEVCTGKLIEYSLDDKNRCIACILNAELLMHMKKREDAIVMMKLAKENSNKYEQQYRKYLRKFGFGR